MTTYICKCGKTFGKNTGAGTTGFRMPDYGPSHECYGCPFVCKITTWDPVTQQNAVQNHECRGSKTIQYDTQAALSRGDKCVGRIYSLDLEFLHRVRGFADTLDGIEPDRYAFSDRPADYGDDGRFKLTIYPAQSNKGIAAKQRIYERFFNPDGSRVDVTPEQEKEIVLNQIKEAKALAQGKTELAGMAYIHGDWRYFVDRREDNGKFTTFMSSPVLGQDVKAEVPTILDFDTFAEAQNALDGFALKKHYAAECSTPEETPEMEQSNEVPGDFGPDGMEELAEYQELTQPDSDSGNDPPESDGNMAGSGDAADETSDPDNDTGDSANDDAEQPPQSCDWKNASGGDDEDEDDPEDEPEEVSGDPLNLRGDEFDYIINPANTALNRFVAMLHAKKQHDGEINIKVTFEDEGGSYIFGGAVSGKINLTMKPQKVTGDAVELQFDVQGNPIVPADREHQLSFDEIQSGQREYPPSGGTATVDGKTGIVEEYQDDEEEADSAEDETPSEAPEDCPEETESTEPEPLYSCEKIDCPFYGVPDDGDAGCCFGSESPDFSGDVWEAVHMHGCQRQGVLDAYQKNDPDTQPNDENEENAS